MGLEDKVKAAAKDVEGKVQEAAGKMADNKEAQVKGKAKQAEAEARKNVEDVKDKAKEIID
ncbi:CsbD family protein [Cyanobacterium stanieri PCC 7202]|uniref:CsbD family protein n=1 Tax=Cyanobacterium stanieri (strain ATCC 29140 / PCC 7202) TaxID=292563 RepID=K9YMM9_CYASC|nr:CsbD family protein [Cyanobacterium stanieri PCC 7202]